ncbi:unnamed protein product [Peniophora sp. CBMAI 1063]|nr:unnamed protein product [Peniophora sp. CBMAI 1063]
MSLTTVPIELWQNIALQVVADVISARDIRFSSLALPDSLLEPLEPASFRYPGTFEDSPQQRTKRLYGPHTEACALKISSSPVPSQALWFSKSKDPSPTSTVASLLAIDRRRRRALYDLPEFWEGIALLIPAATSHALKCTERRPTIPLDFTSHLLLCPCILEMLKPHLSKVTRVDVAISGEFSSIPDPPRLLGQWLGFLPDSELQHLEYRYALGDRLDRSRREHHEHRKVQVQVALNPSFVLYGGALRRLNLAVERWDRAIPGDELVLLLSRCPSLEELALQMVLASSNEVPAVALPVSLPRLRYFLLCGELEEWQYLRPKLSIPEAASIHADLVLPELDLFLNDVDRFAAEGSLSWLSGVGFPSCRVVILHYQTKTPTDRPPDNETPELVTLTFAASEEEAWAEKDPERTSHRWTFTIRFPGLVLNTRYPAGPGADPRDSRSILSHELLVSSICQGIDRSATQVPAIDLKTTEVFIVKAGGRLRPMVDLYHLTRHFPNLKVLVLYGVFNRDSYALKNAIRELRDGTWRSIERVCLPDYDGSGWYMDRFVGQEEHEVQFSTSCTLDDGTCIVNIGLGLVNLHD